MPSARIRRIQELALRYPVEAVSAESFNNLGRHLSYIDGDRRVIVTINK